MASGLIDRVAGAAPGEDAGPSGIGALHGVAPAKVIDNLDSTGQGRVRLELAWLPDVKPWARVCSAGAGAERGFYSIPQVGDEVLVAFAHGDVTDPYVLGGLWTARYAPPSREPQAPTFRRILRTASGHLLDFDDLKQTLTVETPTRQTIVLAPESITLQAGGGAAKVTLETAGAVTIEAGTSITLKAPQINLSGLAVKIEGSSTVQVQGGAACEIQGGLVKIN